MGELEPLENDIRALLAAEKPIAPLPAPREEAILAAVMQRIGLPPGPDGDGGGGADGGPGASGALGLSGARGALALLGTFALGLAAGVIADRAIATLAAPLVTVTVTAAPPSVSAPAAPPETPAVAVTALPTASPTASPPRASRLASTSSASMSPTAHPAPAPSARGLAAERALLDVARSALARGEASEALSAVERHAAEYQDGALVEEREAIGIKALVALGRNDEARARAAVFERRYPNALMLHTVKAAVDVH